MNPSLLSVIEAWAEERRDRWALIDNRQFSVWGQQTAGSDRIQIDFQANKNHSDLIWVGCVGIAEVYDTTIHFKMKLSREPFDRKLDACDPNFFVALELAFIEAGLFSHESSR